MSMRAGSGSQLYKFEDYPRVSNDYTAALLFIDPGLERQVRTLKNALEEKTYSYQVIPQMTTIGTTKFIPSTFALRVQPLADVPLLKATLVDQMNEIAIENRLSEKFIVSRREAPDFDSYLVRFMKLSSER